MLTDSKKKKKKNETQKYVFHANNTQTFKCELKFCQKRIKQNGFL